MTSRDDILAAMRRLTIDTGVLPSMDDVARAAGLSKGGLIHHFATRAALVDGLIGRAVAEVDEGMALAAAAGHAARSWLRLSAPDGDELELYRAMTVALKALGSAQGSAANQDSAQLGASVLVAVAIARWDALLTAELGDATDALIVRLVGDGLFLNALSGTPVPQQDVDAIEHRLGGAVS